MVTMTRVTDPEILARLNEGFTPPKRRKLTRVTDPEILKRLGDPYAPEEEQGFFNKLPRNIAAGLSEAARGIGNVPHALGLPYAPHFEETDFGKMFGIKEEPTLSDKIIQSLAQFIPGIAAPEANLGRAGELIGQIPKAGKFLKGAIGQAIPQAAYGATQNENPLTGAAEGAIGAGIGSGVGAGIEKLVNKLRPSSLLRGNLSPEDLARNLEVTKGTETGLGDVIESPMLKRLQQNILPGVLGSGAESSMQRTGNQLVDTGGKILEGLTGGEITPDYGQKILEALKKSAKDVEKVKANKFNKVNELADKAGLATDRSNLRTTAKSLLKQVESDPDLAKFTNEKDIKLIRELAYPEHEAQITKGLTSKIKQLDENIAKEGRIDLATGKPIDTKVSEKTISVNRPKGGVSVITGKPIAPTHKYSLKSTDILRGKIGEHAYEASVKGEEPKKQLYSRLKKALEKDVEGAIDKTASKELKDAHKEAMDYYRTDYSKFDNPDIRKFIKGDADSDTILPHFLRGGKSDRAFLLSKLSSKLEPESKKLLASAHFSQALNDEGTAIDPLKFRALYNSLGKKQKDVLLGKGELRKSIKDYSDLIGKNTESFNLMFNPKTGARNTDLLTKLSQIVSSAAGGLPAIATNIGLSATARLANKGITSPKLREKLVKGMIEDKKINLPKTKAGLAKIGSFLSQGYDKEPKPMELELVKGR